MYSRSEYAQMINAALEGVLPKDGTPEDGLREGERYSLLAGGKRIRPMLVLEFARVCGAKPEKALPAACAIEMIHTYSLIHDDLPCMDDDDLRRGSPTNHVVFGECNATLAGDALQADAFSVIMESELSDSAKVGCAGILAKAAGSSGMCAGQYLDTNPECMGEPSINTISRIHSYKTGALLLAACKMGVACAGGTAEQMAAAEEYGRNIGLAFQICDDVLDATATTEELGKPAGSDEKENKVTFFTLYGEEKCREMTAQLTQKAVESLKVFEDSKFLAELAESMMLRRT